MYESGEGKVPRARVVSRPGQQHIDSVARYEICSAHSPELNPFLRSHRSRIPLDVDTDGGHKQVLMHKPKTNLIIGNMQHCKNLKEFGLPQLLQLVAASSANQRVYLKSAPDFIKIALQMT